MHAAGNAWQRAALASVPCQQGGSPYRMRAPGMPGNSYGTQCVRAMQAASYARLARAGAAISFSARMRVQERPHHQHHTNSISSRQQGMGRPHCRRSHAWCSAQRCRQPPPCWIMDVSVTPTARLSTQHCTGQTFCMSHNVQRGATDDSSPAPAACTQEGGRLLGRRASSGHATKTRI